jgi:hypothetical protein
MAEDEPADLSGGACFGLLEDTVGLKVTVRWGLGGTAFPGVEPCAKDEISGVVSVEPDAITGAAVGRWAAGEKG